MHRLSTPYSYVDAAAIEAAREAKLPARFTISIMGEANALAQGETEAVQ